METSGATQKVPAVTKIRGEPAILINGLPNSTLKNRKLESKSEPEFDPCFGEWLRGRKVRKIFGDEYYSGKVISYDKDDNWYKVEYEDGDVEDLDWYELEQVLVPLDISIPLKNLALNIGKWDDIVNSASKSRSKRGRVRRENSMTGTSGLETSIDDLTLVPEKVEYKDEEKSLEKKNSKRGKKLIGNESNESIKIEEKLVIASVKEEVRSGEASRRKRDVTTRVSISTVKAEKQKRKEQQSQKS